MALPELLSRFPIIETTRLRLRQMTSADAENFYTYYSNPLITAHLDWSGPASLGHADEVIRTWNKEFDNKRVIPWGLALREDDQLIGTAPCMPIRGTFEGQPLLPLVLGFDLAEPYWNQGLMTEALAAIISYAFNTLGAHRIQAEVAPANTASRYLLKKLGFAEEGIMRKYLYHEGTKDFMDIVLLARLRD